MATLSPQLQKLMQRGCDFLGSRYSIICGAMSWITERNLVAAVSNNGGFGTLASGAMTPDLLREEIRATKALTSKNFGVNIIVIHPQLEALIDVCLEEGVKHIVLAGGPPPSSAAKKIKDGGGKLICFAPAAVLAKRLVRTGVDALIIEGMESGGHIGSVCTSVLTQEILPVINEVPVFVGGGIARGEMMLAHLEMGAAGVQLGTQFVCTTECVAHPNFKQAYIRAAARDAIPTQQLDPRFPVIPVRALENEGTCAFCDKQREVIARVDKGELTREQGQLEIEHFWVGALRRAVVDGDVERGSVMAGQIVGLVKEGKPVAAILDGLITEAEEALKKRCVS